MSQTLEGLSDNLLLEQCKRGSEAAFNVLFRRYFNKLHQFSLRYVKDETIAESLVLDLLSQIWQKSARIDTTTAIAPYLFTAMKNTLFNHIRKKNEATVSLDEITEQSLLTNSTDEELETKELTIIYRALLEQLSPQRKKVFEMSRDKDMSHKEIATELKLSVNTVENHISASILFLRQNLKEHIDIAFGLLFFFLF